MYIYNVVVRPFYTIDCSEVHLTWLNSIVWATKSYGCSHILQVMLLRDVVATAALDNQLFALLLTADSPSP